MDNVGNGYFETIEEVKKDLLLRKEMCEKCEVKFTARQQRSALVFICYNVKDLNCEHCPIQEQCSLLCRPCPSAATPQQVKELYNCIVNLTE